MLKLTRIMFGHTNKPEAGILPAQGHPKMIPP